MNRSILVWDLPTRIFHWLLALSFAGAYLTAESERWSMLHLLFGYTLLILLVFRLIWGIFGTRYARFADFVRGPRAVIAYATSLLQGRLQPTVGHNPAGSVAIVSLLFLGLVSSLSGWLLLSEGSGEWMEEAHEIAANLMLAVVVIHVVGVLASSWAYRENLIRPMITGKKEGKSVDGIPDSKPWVAWLLIAVLTGFWAWSIANPDILQAAGDERGLSQGNDDDDDD